MVRDTTNGVKRDIQVRRCAQKSERHTGILSARASLPQSLQPAYFSSMTVPLTKINFTLPSAP